MSKPKKNRWNIWFYSDPHFGHGNVINFCNRPFKDVNEMTEKLIEKYNNKVKENDLTIWVGDCFFYLDNDERKAIMNRLNGRKVLVRGNHDLKNKQMMNIGFEISVDEMIYSISNERVLICHYPFRISRWLHEFYNFRSKICRKFGIKKFWSNDLRFYKRRPKNEGQFLIHGHTHDKVKYKNNTDLLSRFLFKLGFKSFRKRMIHVGVDAWNYEPVSLNKIANIIDEIKENEIKSKN